MSSPPIVIIGAGIIGLTTAVRILESPKPHGPVHILADHLPNDPLDARYASTIAGAHHLSFAADDDERQRRWDRRTFEVMHQEWKDEGESTGLMEIPQTEYHVGTREHLKIYEEHPDFISLDNSKSIVPCDHSISFTSLTMTPLVYLNRLVKRIEQSGGHIHRHHLPSIQHLSHPSTLALIGRAPSVVIICVGLGALTLGGVEDDSVYPVRGQVIKVKAPWVRRGYTRQVGDLEGGEGGSRTYVIPRADGEVILGGTREENDWYPYPREETSVDILKRTKEICPAVETADVVAHLVGFRPARRGGIRLEKGYIEDQKVVYNYGHGGAGWQSCWGTAEDAAGLALDSILHDHVDSP